MTNLHLFVVFVVFGLLLFVVAAQAQTYTVLYNFTGGTDSGLPAAQPTQDSAGNLYGTTELRGKLRRARRR